MASLAEVAKYLVPALAGIAGAVQPKTAGALTDIVSMRQAFKDKERQTRREDESDARAAAGEERAKAKFDATMQEYGRSQEQLAKTDATIGGIMRNLPSSYTENPIVIAMANEGDVAGIMQFVEKDIAGRQFGGDVLSYAASVNPQKITPEIKRMVKDRPELIGTALQSLAPKLVTPQEATMSPEDFAALDVPPNASISAEIEYPGGAKARGAKYDQPRSGTSSKIPDEQNPVVVVRRTEDYLGRVNEIVNRYNRLSDMNTKSKSGKDDPKRIKERNDEIDALRKEYLTARGNYRKDTEKFPDAYRAPLMDWETLIKKKGLEWSLPKEVSDAAAATEKKPVSKPDTGGLPQEELDRLYLEQIDRKLIGNEIVTREEFDRYWEIKKRME